MAVRRDNMTDEARNDPCSNSSTPCSFHGEKTITVADPGTNVQPISSTHSFRTIIISQRWVFVVVIILLGSAASAAFLSLGIVGGKQEEKEQFYHEAEAFTKAIVGTWGNFELYSQWIHNSCTYSIDRRSDIPIEEDFEGHMGFCSRATFRNIYESILSTDVVEFQSAQLLPKTYPSERYELERQSKLYYEEKYDNYFNYSGMTQQKIGSDGKRTLVPRSEEDFYWPVHFVEPVKNNEGVVGFDSYSLVQTQKLRIQKAVDTFRSVLSKRLVLVQETESDVYGIVLTHPGVVTSIFNVTTPIAVSQIVIRVPDFLARAAKGAVINTSVHLYDRTETDSDPDFLGAVTITIVDNKPHVSNLPETAINSITSQKGRHKFTQNISIADREWTLVIVPVDNDTSKHVYIILGGIIIFLLSVLLAVWFCTHISRITTLNKLRADAEIDKANTAQKQATQERHMNEFLCHEVRNPLSSAISALSFVSCTVNDPNECHIANEQVQKTLSTDLRVMDASLQFINELMRNMLDIHRSATKQIEIALKPTDICRDILEPVASILFLRGASIEVQVVCPKDLMADTDRMRLKQIILNLSSNATKFVQRGYIRLRSEIVDDSVEISVEDSGPGIPMQKRDRLFAKFQESLDSLNQGTGIGLAVCKNLSDLMGATIWLDESFESGVEGCLGTRFVIRLNQPGVVTENQRPVLADDNDGTVPLLNADGSISDTPNDSEERLSIPERLSVLFVDDDTIIRKMFNRSLSRVAPQWTFEEASNGETALRLMETKSFDIIFMDQYMASIEKQLLGTDTVRTMRSRGIQSIICGLSANDMEQQFLAAGANAFMLKPFPCEKKALTMEINRILTAGQGNGTVSI